MRRIGSRYWGFLLFALLVLLAAGMLSADRLVTVDGQVIETAGPWEAKGRLLLFKLPNGQLSSLRVDDVDLEASREATEAAGRPVETEAPPPVAERQSVLKLTDADVRHVARVAPAEPEAEGDETTGEKLRIGDWNRIDNEETGGVAIAGAIQNVSRDALGEIRVEVTLLYDDGSILARDDAALTSRALMPRQNLRFRAEFPTVFDFSDVSIETFYTALKAEPEGDEQVDSFQIAPP